MGALKHAQNEFLINVAIFAEMPDAQYRGRATTQPRILRLFGKTEPFLPRTERKFELEFYFAGTAQSSRDARLSLSLSLVLRNKKFNFKRARDCLSRNARPRRQISLRLRQRCGTLRNHDFLGASVPSARRLHCCIIFGRWSRRDSSLKV